MKLILAVLLGASALFGQAVRVDPNPTTTTQGNAPPGSYQPILAVPGSRIGLCANSSCSVAAVSYSDMTAATACPPTAPLVPIGSSGCVATADAQGNFGFWLKPGQYWYTVQYPNGNRFGPFPISAGNGTEGKEGKALAATCSVGSCVQVVMNQGVGGHGQGQNVGVWCYSGPLTSDEKVSGDVVLCSASNDGLGNITFSWTGARVKSLLVMGNGPGPQGPPGEGSVDLVSVVTYGVNGSCSDAANFALGLAATAGKKTLWVPPGVTVNMCGGSAVVPSGARLLGNGSTSIISCGGIVGTGVGCLDVTAANITIDGINFQGNTLTPAPVLYSFAIPRGPQDSFFTTGSTIWLHGGSKYITIKNCTFDHSQSYPIYGDATTGTIMNVDILANTFKNSRAFIFGTTAGQEQYGGWVGGPLLYGPGAGYNYQNVNISGNACYNVIGTCIWTHTAAATLLSTGITIDGNTGQDLGLDFIQLATADGWSISGNKFNRLGYVVTSDYGASTRTGGPKWIQGYTPVGIDFAAAAINGVINANTGGTVNGEMIDCDGCGTTTVSNNVMVSCFYSSDLLASSGQCGPSTSVGVNWVRGMTVANSNNLPQVGLGLNIIGNEFYGVGGGMIAAFATRQSLISGNTGIMPNTSQYDPIILGNSGTGPYQRAYSNTVTGNVAHWIPSTGQPMIFEDSATASAPFQSGDKNLVFNNVPIGTGLYEFAKDPVTSSGTGPTVASSVTPGAQPKTQVNCVVEGQGTSQIDFAYKCYSDILGVGTQLFQFDNATGLTLPASRAFVMGAQPIVDSAFNGTFHSLGIIGVGPLLVDDVGRINPTLPTVCTALPAGTLWNDTGTVKVCP